MSRLKHESVPLGEVESDRLEFKSRDALRDLTSVGKGVVAFLNSKGGRLWIGLEERDARAISVEPIPDPIREGRRVQDFLLDTIEPPLAGEVEVAPVDQVLLVRVSSSANQRPYAFVKSGARHFLVRVGAQNRPMTREEVAVRFQKLPQETDALREAVVAMDELRMKARRNLSRVMWMAVRPAGTLEVRVQDPGLRDLLIEPHVTGNRFAGWTFASPWEQPRLKARRLVSGRENQRFTRISGDGTIEFSVPLSALHWSGDDPYELWPYCLVEWPVSVMRLAGTLYRMQGRPAGDDRILADLAMFGAAEYWLRPHSPGSIYNTLAPAGQPRLVEPDLEWRPLVLPYDEVVDEPDRCTFRLVRRIYDAFFGEGEDKIPQEFNRREMRLVLPE